MNDEELKRLWAGQKLDAPAKLSSEGQVGLIRKKMKRMACLRLWNLVWEAGDLAVFTPIFGWLVWYFLKPALLVYAGLVIIFSGSVLNLWRELRAYRAAPPPAADAPTMEWLRHDLAMVRAQYELDRAVFWWRLLPFWVGMNVFCWGLNIELPARIGCTVLMTVFCLGHWKLNRHTLQRHWPPLKEELESLVKSNGLE